MQEFRPLKKEINRYDSTYKLQLNYTDVRLNNKGKN